MYNLPQAIEDKMSAPMGWVGGSVHHCLIDLVKYEKLSTEIQTSCLITKELSQELFRAAVERVLQIRIHSNSFVSGDNIEAFISYKTYRKSY